eukprot:576470-Prorocentrum_minimum.AAC.1
MSYKNTTALSLLATAGARPHTRQLGGPASCGLAECPPKCPPKFLFPLNIRFPPLSAECPPKRHKSEEEEKSLLGKAPENPRQETLNTGELVGQCCV